MIGLMGAQPSLAERRALGRAIRRSSCDLGGSTASGVQVDGGHEGAEDLSGVTVVVREGEEVDTPAGDDGRLDGVGALRDPSPLPVDGDLRLLAARDTAAAGQVVREVLVDLLAPPPELLGRCDRGPSGRLIEKPFLGETKVAVSSGPSVEIDWSSPRLVVSLRLVLHRAWRAFRCQSIGRFS